MAPWIFKPLKKRNKDEALLFKCDCNSYFLVAGGLNL